MADPESLDRGRFEVLGVAIGDVESDFCARMSTELVKHANVARAYLAVVSLDGAHDDVALGLRFDGEDVDQNTIEACSRVFHDMFSVSQSLVIVPLDRRLEAKLSDVPPFYVRAGVN